MVRVGLKGCTSVGQSGGRCAADRCGALGADRAAGMQHVRQREACHVVKDGGMAQCAPACFVV
jgi:hypothetical protein